MLFANCKLACFELRQARLPIPRQHLIRLTILQIEPKNGLGLRRCRLLIDLLLQTLDMITQLGIPKFHPVHLIGVSHGSCPLVQLNDDPHDLVE